MTRRTATVILRTSAVERCVSRLLAQGLLEYTQPRRRVVLACAAVDAVHAASMVMAAITRGAYRRTAAVSAVEATVSAILGGALTKRLPGEISGR